MPVPKSMVVLLLTDAAAALNVAVSPVPGGGLAVQFAPAHVASVAPVHVPLAARAAHGASAGAMAAARGHAFIAARQARPPPRAARRTGRGPFRDDADRDTPSDIRL